MGLIERRELAAERRGSVPRRPRAGPEGRVLRRWLPCRRPCGAANGRAPAARSLAFGVWGVLHFRECWRRLGGGGPVRGAGAFGDPHLYARIAVWGRKGCRRRLLCNPRPTPLSCTSATCKVCILLVAQSSTRRAKCTHKEHATCAEYSKCMY